MSDSLERLPFEVLALIASWLDMHDLVYRLPYVSKLICAIANDPVTWSRAVVKPCSWKELEFVLSKVRYLSACVLVIVCWYVRHVFECVSV